MKIVLDLLKLSSFIFLIAFFQSCNKDLTREEAKELIIIKNNFPIVTTREYSLSVQKNYDIASTSKDVSIYNPPELDFLSNLQSAGLVTYSINLLSSEIYDETWYDEDGTGYSSPNDYWTGKDAGRTHKFNIKATYLHSGTLTENGRHDFVSENTFKVSTTEFGEITGIVKNDGLNITEVEYTIVETPTSFGKIVYNMQQNVRKQTVGFPFLVQFKCRNLLFNC